MAKKRKLVETAAPVVAAPVKEEPPEEEQQQQQPVEEEEEEEEQQQTNFVEEEVDEEMDAGEEKEGGGGGEDGEEEVEEEAEEDEENPNTQQQNASNSNTDASTVTASIQSNANAADGGAVEDDDDSEEPFQKLIEPFTKSQLADLLREASEKHSDVLDSIRKLADVDPVHRKIFVHGLGWDTNAETLISVFKQYGEIEDCKAVCDKVSGKSKGYGFILFKHRSGARKALKEPQKKIGNRMTACQLASSGPVPTPAPAAPPVSEYTQRKIYVSNVSADIDPQKLLGYFAKFGEIEEGPLGLDKQSGKPKGFALFVYRSPESARKALEEPHKNFEGHILHCQKAIDGPKPNKPYFHQPTHSSSGGGGGGGHGGSHFSRNHNPKYNDSSAGHMGPGASGHMMAQAGPGMQYNQPQQALNPVLGQAITALLATQGGAGLGLTNLLGSLGSSGMGAPGSQPVPMVNSAMQGGYGNQHGNPNSNMMAAYGSQPGMQGGYPNSQMGQPNPGRSQQGGGHMGGVAPYMGH